MIEPNHPMSELFDQLGLDSNPKAIEQFIKEHSLKDSMRLHEADFWTPSQAVFLRETWPVTPTGRK